MTRPFSSGERENRNRIGWSRVRRSRRDEMHSLPHVLWRLAEKVAPVGTGSFMFAPANHRKGHAGFPCRRRHRKPVMPLASWRFAPLCTPKAACATSCLWRSFLTRGTSGTDSLAPAHPQVSRQPSRTQVVTPPAFATQRECGRNSLPKPGRKWGLGNELLCSFAFDFRQGNRHLIAIRTSYSGGRRES